MRNQISGTLYLSIHAEIDALVKFIKLVFKNTNLKDLERIQNKKRIPTGATVYVVRKTYDNKGSCSGFGKSMPCNRCQYYLELCGVKKIKYTDNINGTDVICEMKLR